MSGISWDALSDDFADVNVSERNSQVGSAHGTETIFFCVWHSISENVLVEFVLWDLVNTVPPCEEEGGGYNHPNEEGYARLRGEAT